MEQSFGNKTGEILLSVAGRGGFQMLNKTTGSICQMNPAVIGRCYLIFFFFHFDFIRTYPQILGQISIKQKANRNRYKF